MSDLKILKGGCHCGNLRIEFGTNKSPEDVTPRACDCSFCMKHGAAYVADRSGSLSIHIKDPDAISEYRQGSGSARCVVCRSCGVLVAVLFDGDDRTFGTINYRCFDAGTEFSAPTAVSPQKIKVEERRRLWLKSWIPGVRITTSRA